MLHKWITLIVFNLFFWQAIGETNLLETDFVNDGRNQLEEHETQVFKIPQLVLRPIAFSKYLLDVYNPEGMTDFVQNKTAKISNPSCKLDGGNLMKSNAVTLEFVSKSEVSSLDVDHTLTKATYKVITESQGYLRCEAEIFDNGVVKSTRKLYRYIDHGFAMNVIYNCTKACGKIKLLTKRLNENFRNNMDKSLPLYLDEIIVIPIRKTVENDTTLILYRIDITLSHPLQLKQGDARKKISKQKEIDAELLNFLNDVVHNHFTAEDLSNGTCTYIRSTKYCPANKVEGLSWPVTEIGMKAATDQLCVGSDGGPVVLECLGDYTLGAFWDAIPQLEVSSDTDSEGNFQRIASPRANQVILTPECQSPTARMNTLYQLSRNKTVNEIMPNENIKKLVLVLTQEDGNDESAPLTKVEINLVADALSNFSPDAIDLADVSAIVNITNSLLKIPEYVDESEKIIYTNELKCAQEASNSSNRILDSLDRVLNEAKINISPELIITENFVSLIMDISPEITMNRIRGLGAMKTHGSQTKSFNAQNVILLTEYDQLEDVLEMDISMAVLVPLSLYQRANRLVINLFRQDSLFGSRQTVGKTNMVLSVTLNGKRYQNLDAPLILLFESDPYNRYFQGSFAQSPCVFWDFQADDNNGGWSNYGCELAKPHYATLQAFDVCLCSHLTHFAELLREYPADIISTIDKLALDIITIIGCSLSLIGLIAIGVTAVIFPAWRKGASKKVQLGLCASLALLMTSFLVVSFTKGKYEYEGIMESTLCRVSGFLLHYSVLSSFCWMIVAAWGQYLRLTKPLISLNRQPHFILKSSLFAWGLPLVPCIIVLAINYQTYDLPNCYPAGNFLYYSVLLPVVLAVAVNGTLFMLILFSIYNCFGLGMGLVQLRNNQSKRRVAFRKLATVMFLFVLLGMSWIFGIMGMRYLFCITASTQGFAVFIFFVVLDKSTRGKWCTLVEPKKEVQVLNSYSNSADFIRRWSRQSRTHSRYASTRISTLSDSR